MPATPTDFIGRCMYPDTQHLAPSCSKTSGTTKKCVVQTDTKTRFIVFLLSRHAILWESLGVMSVNVMENPKEITQLWTKKNYFASLLTDTNKGLMKISVLRLTSYISFTKDSKLHLRWRFEQENLRKRFVPKLLNQ